MKIPKGSAWKMPRFLWLPSILFLAYPLLFFVAICQVLDDMIHAIVNVSEEFKECTNALWEKYKEKKNERD